MNSKIDEWGYDPTVQRVRKLFGLMEKAQQSLLAELQISVFDSRLNAAREAALSFYEAACCGNAAGRLARTENAYAALYASCFVLALQQQRVEIPGTVLAAHSAYFDLISGGASDGMP